MLTREQLGILLAPLPHAVIVEIAAHDAALRDALATSEKERVRWQKYYEAGLKVDAELKARVVMLEAALTATKRLADDCIGTSDAKESFLSK